MPMPTIGKMKLDNEGGFVARMMFSYADDNGNWQQSSATGDITLGLSKTVDPSDLGVPDGTMVSLYVFVVWGTDNKANQSFLYQKGNGSTANYSISGTTLSNHLGLENIS